MALQELKSLFPDYQPPETDRNVLSSGTSKGHKHIQGKQFKPKKKLDITPAEYRHRSVKNNRIKKAKAKAAMALLKKSNHERKLLNGRKEETKE